MKKFNTYKLLALGGLLCMSSFAFAKTEKVIQIFSNGEVIQQYAVSEIDYIEVNEVLVGSEYDYTVKSADKSNNGSFGSAFIYKNPLDDSYTFNYSTSSAKHFSDVGESTGVEIFVGAKELYDGTEFNVAETEYPFYFKFQYTSGFNLKTVVIDNDNRAGAEGTISLIPNARGTFDAVFDVTMDSGDVTIKGYYAGDYQPRNTIYSSKEGVLAIVKGATLDLSSNPCVLYFTSNDGEAGPENYDVMCEVPANEWRYGIFMSFSAQSSSVKWLDGFTYSYDTLPDEYYGGNWRVMEPTYTPDGIAVTQCSVTLFGTPSLKLYYYGQIKIIE